MMLETGSKEHKVWFAGVYISTSVRNLPAFLSQTLDLSNKSSMLAWMAFTAVMHSSPPSISFRQSTTSCCFLHNNNNKWKSETFFFPWRWRRLEAVAGPLLRQKNNCIQTSTRSHCTSTGIYTSIVLDITLTSSRERIWFDLIVVYTVLKNI